MAVKDGVDVFLSCAGPDRAAARALRTALEKHGLVVFLDEDRIVTDPSGRAVEWLVREALEGREHTYASNPYMIR